MDYILLYTLSFDTILTQDIAGGLEKIGMAVIYYVTLSQSTPGHYWSVSGNVSVNPLHPVFFISNFFISNKASKNSKLSNRKASKFEIKQHNYT